MKAQTVNKKIKKKRNMIRLSLSRMKRVIMTKIFDILGLARSRKLERP